MVDAHPRFGLARRALFAGLTVAVAATAAVFTPAAAYADDQAVIDEWAQLTSQQLNDEDFQAHTSDGLDTAALASVQSTDSVDLREQGLVTSVKNQSPWNTCWAFSAIAASESSILSATKAQGTMPSSLDLSELQLAALVYANGGVPQSVAGEAQAGECSYGFVN